MSLTKIDVWGYREMGLPSLPRPAFVWRSRGFCENRKLPTVPVWVMKPKPHVLGARRFRTDLVTRVFEFDLLPLQPCERCFEFSHAAKVEGHVLERLRPRHAFHERDVDVFVAHDDTIRKFEFHLQPHDVHPEARALARVANRQHHVTDMAKFDRHVKNLPGASRIH